MSLRKIELFKDKKIFAWAMYDWANSAFATTVMAGFFPLFFKQYWSYGTDINTSTAQLGFANSIAGFFIAVFAPVLGAIADRGSIKKKFLIFFAYIGVLMTFSLFLVQKGNFWLAIFIYSVGVIGFSCANIFYDSLLPDITDETNVHYVSGLGYALGYIGGGLLFLLNVVMVLKPHLFGISDPSLSVRLSFLTVALWWGCFTLFLIFWVPEKNEAKSNNLGFLKIISEGLNQFLQTLKKIRSLKTVFLFLIAYWFYIDGVDTIIRMAVDYGLSIGFNSNDLIIALLITQFIGFPSAIVFGKLGQKFSVRKSIYFCLAMYSFITLWGAFITQKHEFYVLAIMIGFVQGGVQALSRSYYSTLIPKGKEAEFFGFYNMLGKFAVIFGPLLVGSVAVLTKRILINYYNLPKATYEINHLAARLGIASILVFFIIGGVIFYFVDEEKGKKEIESF
jgi:MFS transporter, UMF1 family